ncbi:CASPA protein, partial [Formicarius rufipectus]|nr:CASPA protein [Formicarius rufipectus]
TMEDDVSLNFHQQLLSISEDLVAEEVEALKFLCTDLLPRKKLEGVKSAVDIFDLLMHEAYLTAEDPFLLAELLYRIKCNFLLKKLGYTPEKVQERLPEKGRVSPYRQMLYELSENITNEMVKNITFLLQNNLPKRWSTLIYEEGDKCAYGGKSALDLLTLLEKQDLLTENNVQILEEVCEKVSPSLLKIINCYKKAKGEKFRQKYFLLLLQKLGVLPSFCPTEMHKSRCMLLCSEQKGTGVNGVFDFNPRLDLNTWYLKFSFSLSFLQKKIYKMDGPHRGFCLVINNVKFENSERTGSYKDAEELERVFTWLGLDVRICTNLTSGQIIDLMETWQHLPDHKERNCFICCILSHGESGAIHGTDGKPVSIRTIMSHFTASKCPQLTGKPKLFFIQACQGKNIQHPVNIEVDAQVHNSSSMQQSISLSESIPEDADFLLGLATVDGCVAFRHSQQGTWYIQALCNNLQLLVPRGEDILSILAEVNGDVASRVNKGAKQMPQPAYTLRGKVVFPIPKDPPPS